MKTTGQNKRTIRRRTLGGMIRERVRRILSVALSVSMVMCSMPVIPAYAAPINEDDEVQEFTLTSADISAAISKALDGDPIEEKDYGFAGAARESYEELFYGSSETAVEVYELFPKFEKDKDGSLSLRVFLRMGVDRPIDSIEFTGEEELVFLLLNNSKDEQTARIYVDENMSGLIEVAPRKDVVLGNEDIIGPASKEADEAAEASDAAVSAGGGAGAGGSGTDENGAEAEEEAEEAEDDKYGEEASVADGDESTDEKADNAPDDDSADDRTGNRSEDKSGKKDDAKKDDSGKGGSSDRSDKADESDTGKGSGSESGSDNDTDTGKDSGRGNNRGNDNESDRGNGAHRGGGSGKGHNSDSGNDSGSKGSSDSGSSSGSSDSGSTGSDGGSSSGEGSSSSSKELSYSNHHVGVFMAKGEDDDKEDINPDTGDDTGKDNSDAEIIIEPEGAEEAESGADEPDVEISIGFDDEIGEEVPAGTGDDADADEDTEYTTETEIVIEPDEGEGYIAVEAEDEGKDITVDTVVTVASDSDAEEEEVVYKLVEGEVYDAVIVKKKNKTFAGVAYVAKMADILTPAEGDTLIYEGEDYTVKVIYDYDALLPYGVSLEVSEYEKDSDTYRDRILEAAEMYDWDEDAILEELDAIDTKDVDEEDNEEDQGRSDIDIISEDASDESYYVDKVRIFDISLYVDDHLVEPAAEVEVEFTFEDQDDEAEYKVIHFMDDDENEEIDTETSYEGDAQIVTFSVSQFSDFAVVDSGIMLLSDPNLSTVSALTVSSITDGTAPWDEGDDAEGNGNDSGPMNKKVRSFDYIEYSLGFTTALRDGLSGSVEDGNLMIEFTLYQDPSVAEFDMSTLNWCLDPVVTYYYGNDDTTGSTTWDKSTTVTKQVLTGMRHIGSTDGDAIPGSGSLTVGIYVKAASNGTVIQPTFTVYMEGNNVETEAKTVTPAAVTVTAAPRYNIRLYRNSLCDGLGYFDLTNGTMSTTKQSDSDIYGRIEGYGITVQLYNDYADKGLKGVELPAGKITFNVKLTTTLGGTDKTADDDYHPLLWDYEEATAESVNKTGHLGRTMAAFGVSRASYAYLSPGNKAGATDRYCYDGGRWSITQNQDDYSLSVVLDGGYLFDEENFVFPEYGLGDTSTTPRFSANIGSFSSGYVQIIATFPEDAAQESTQNFVFGVEVVEGENGMKVTSVSGQTPTAEMTYSDNTSTETLTMYPSGSISKWNWYRKANSSALDNDGSSQDGSCYGYQGEAIQIASEIKYTGDTPLSGYNILQKFDDEALEVVPTAETGYEHYTNVNSNSTYDSITVLYAAKPDKSGWLSDAEMLAAHEEDLIYFTSLDALEATECTCVGLLYEVRGTFYAMPGTGNYIYMNMNILDNAEIGSVYQTVNTARAWQQGFAEATSWTEFPYDSIEGAYGWGYGGGWTTNVGYHEGYAAPAFIAPHETDYQKTVYENGAKSGHTNANQAGDSLLIIGDKTTVSITVADTTETSSGGETAKTVYDLDQGERTVTYEVTPSISVVSANSETETSEDTDNITLTITLPVGLSYDYGSAEKDPYNVTENADGTTTIVWTYKDVKVATDSLESFKFTCTIGSAGTAADVGTGDTLTITAEITSDKDSRESKSSYGNISETTISVIRLAGSSISKTVESAYSEIGEEITFHLRYGNTSDSEQIDDELLDILPYNGDGRNTKYTGSYQVSKVVVDLSQAEETWEMDQADSYNHTVYIEYTNDDTIRKYTEEQIDNLLEGTVESADLDLLGFTTLTEGDGSVDSDNKTITWDLSNIKDVIALYIRLDDIYNNEYVDVSITLSVRDNDGLYKDDNGITQEPGNVYGNDFYQYYLTEASVVTSNIARCTVVEREINGLIWVDENRDGAQDSSENLFEGATVTIYRTTPSSYDPDPENEGDKIPGIAPPLYTVYDVMGNEVKPMTTDEEGAYEFTLLEAGTYYVVFTDSDDGTPSPTSIDIATLSSNNGSFNIYGLTMKDAAADTIDSDATATILDGKLENAYIELTLPETTDMTSDQYKSENNDAGLVTAPFDVEKVDGSTMVNTLEGAVFTLKDDEENYLTFNEKGVYIGTQTAESDGTVPEAAKLTTDEDGKISVSGLEVGLMATLTEIEAPEGYHLYGNETWDIEVKIYEQSDSWLSYVYVSNQTIDEKNPLVVANWGTVNISGEKVWDDADNQDGKRPDSITINLMANGVQAEDENGNAITAIASASDWSFSFNGLPQYDSDGKEITYTITENNVDDYKTEIEITQKEETGDYVITVTNSHTPETTQISVVKEWEDNKDEDKIRPENITVKLLANDNDTGQTLTLDESNNWLGSFTDLPVYNDGEKITYTIEEISVDDYVTTGGELGDPDEDGNYSVEITNTLIKPILSKSVHEDDYDYKDHDNMHTGEGDDPEEGDGFGHWDDADNNQEVTYHLRLKEIREVKNLTVHDYLEEGLDFVSGSVKVTLHDSDSEKELSEDDYTVIETKGNCNDPEPEMKSCTFEVKFEDQVFENVSSEAYLVIAYESLTDTHPDDYDDYEDDIENYSYMTYGVNPLALRRSVVVQTETDLFGFGVYKYGIEDDKEVALPGAEFELARGDKKATFMVETDDTTKEDFYMVLGFGDVDLSHVEGSTITTTLVSDSSGMIRIEGLDDDTYTLTETQAPDGYELDDQAAEITLKIDEYGNVSVTSPTSTGSKEAVSGHVINIQNYGANKSVDKEGEVNVGDELTYTITYDNPENATVTVTITDLLDEGLDFIKFVDASPSEASKEYDDNTRTITWVINGVEPHVTGSVSFTAKVNENALVKNEVENTAEVQIGDHPAKDTNTVDNPVPPNEDTPSGGGGGGHHSSGGSGGSGGGSGSGGPGDGGGSSGDGDTWDLLPMPQTGQGWAMLFGTCALVISAIALIVLLWYRRKEKMSK